MVLPVLDGSIEWSPPTGGTLAPGVPVPSELGEPDPVVPEL
jgi:hypothetical protein